MVDLFFFFKKGDGGFGSDKKDSPKMCVKTANIRNLWEMREFFEKKKKKKGREIDTVNRHFWV
jgi:hypothetical protein